MVHGEQAKKMADKWFLEQDAILIKKLKKKREKKIKKEAEKEKVKKREKLKKTHWLCCPKCGHDMKVKKLLGIEVDICTLCEGIYFDRGELERLIMKHAENRKGFFRRLIGLKESSGDVL